MVNLIPQPPCGDLLPLEIGRCRVQEADLGHLTSIAPFAGQEDATSKILTKTHDLALPAPNRTTISTHGQLLWFGHDVFLLVGPGPSPDLAKNAALTDQSDGWAAVTVEGPDVADVLARLVPIDLRATAFKTGHTARTLLGHMTVSITRTEADKMLLLVFRSMAHRLIHELKVAMEALAARG